ncbi:MerR family DNA-binding transcriptional regulator [Serratia plymuthica]|uniref:MerR family DNA-binding transcriptional regulator n=1 Tax=Serratia plymuthica TaxID=82996 RepID=UPI0018D8A013|nr:MerR family DNA-binding transcriptional regulator [Serratia plymuthica]QPS53726.1 MerR family DNA-binding transcriptional regulator [Serratia plymuthica]CAI1589274.1 Mercuric resistance operon regulatory protein [Serratia plymuthica]
MKIGELAERSGITASAIRYYEQQGLLPKAVRGANGYRLYGQASLERLHLIQLGQSLGFTLEAMGNLLALEGIAYEDSLTQNLDARLAEIDRVMATLSAQRKSLLEAKRKLAILGIEGMCQEKETSDLVTKKTAGHRQKSDDVTTTSSK